MAKAYRLLRGILNDAVEDGLLTRNPCTIRGAGIERSPERPVASIAQVYGLADAMEDRYRLMVLLATFCGLRLGELLGLRRDRIDVLHRRVIVNEQRQELSNGTRYDGSPKTDAGVRTVALPPHLLAEVEDHLQRWVGPSRPTCCSPGPRRPSSTERRSTVRGTGLVERSAWGSSTSTICAIRATRWRLGREPARRNSWPAWVTPALELPSSISTHRKRGTS